MNKKRIVLLAGVLLGALLLAGAAGATAVFAQDPTPLTEMGLRASGPAGLHGRDRGGMLGWARTDWTQFDAAADALGLTPVELFTELHGGKTMDEIAEEQGVELTTVQEAMGAVRAEAVRASIEQAVADGTMSQEEADWMLEGLEQGYTFGRRGVGRGGRPGADHPAMDK